MFINDLINKWGINFSQFEKMKFVKNYKPVLYPENSKNYGYFCLNTSKFLIDEIKSNVSKNSPVFTKDSKDIKKRIPIMWTAYLSKNPEEVTIPKLDIDIFAKHPNSDLDKGHLLAKRFIQYIGSNKDEIKPFFYKNKRSNIIYQFINVNRNFNSEYGQSLFEARVAEEIKRNNSTVYYQIEPIFFEEDDLIPIGTRIIAFRDTDDKEDFNSDREKIKVPFHVFVPNYDNKKQDENIKLNRQFYKYGPENLRNGK